MAGIPHVYGGDPKLTLCGVSRIKVFPMRKELLPVEIGANFNCIPYICGVLRVALQGGMCS